MTQKLFHIGTGVVLVGLLVLLSDPFMLFMPTGMQLAVLLCAAVFASIWAGFVTYEKAHDEREAAHKLYAGRVAYLSGIVVLTFALVTQGLADNIDPWIPATLGIMVVVKLAARLYSEHYR